ncbi:efflux RND transporter periplasmic adaptor subunit [Pseudoxanthomonas sacheonensis]|uniref:efflux RND transporter periplasmic adaptor subunit n=1 Tax=Pseudoxanthomonas sacheonensis TaxID=443615 RepID=UPI0013D13C3E|nr:efflux RND transporter periplasmic adaptor subunit [Pseudoxanthomonas sacheonensis]KAF1710729.1 efflux transporter periplasmic adaptor subunit [Pseudoxanthomonas sacheonensis]
MTGRESQLTVRTRGVLAAGLSLALAACGSGPPAPAALPALSRLETATAQTTGDARGRAWDGVVEAVQQATLAAQTTGRVTAVNVDVNDRVAAGDVLLRLTAVEQQAGADTARAQLRAAEAAAMEAETNYRRFAALASGQYVSRAQVDLARATRDSAAAARDAARAQLAQAGQQAEYTVVRAPFAGIVSAREVEPGESVVPGQALLSLHAPGALRVEVQVPQSDAAGIRAANRARIVLDDGRSLDAAQVIVFPAADPSTHSVGVRAVLPDVADAPQPGITAKVVFPIAGNAGLVRIPAGAVMQRGEVSGVYVLASGNRIALRQVRLGQRIGDEMEVVAGLKAGEKVALDPVAAGQALAAQRKTAAGTGHG